MRKSVSLTFRIFPYKIKNNKYEQYKYEPHTKAHTPTIVYIMHFLSLMKYN